MRLARRIAAVIQAFCIVIICLFTSITLPTFNMALYEWQFERHDVQGVIQYVAGVHVTEDELLRVMEETLAYMRGDRADLIIEAVVDGEVVPSFFTEREILHMRDVYILFAVGFVLRTAAIVLLAAALALALVWGGRETFALYAKTNIMVIGAAMGLFAVTAAVCMVNFDRAFVVFHEIFFFNDLWQLNPRADLLVNMVPTPFFIEISIIIAVLFTAMMGVVGFVSFLFWRRVRKERQT